MELRVWERQTSACADCGGERVVYTGEFGNDQSTAAVFGAFLYDHEGNPEVFSDVVFGTWGEAADFEDHVTFGSRDPLPPGAGAGRAAARRTPPHLTPSETASVERN